MLALLGPMPRLRLYTTSDHYTTTLKALLTGTVNAGDDVAGLEAAMQRHLGVAGAVAMPMARVGIHAVIKALVPPGRDVVMSPYTIADVVNMVVAAGGRPVFADIERETCNIDPARVAELVHEDTGAILATHFYGLMCDMPAIMGFAEAASVPVVEDAAQAFGARLGNRQAGTIGTAGVYSFGLYKNVNSFRGGMAVSDDATVLEAVRGEIADYAEAPPAALLRDLVKGLMVDTVTAPALFRTVFFRLFRAALLRDWDVINDKLKVDTKPQLVRDLPKAYRRRLSAAQARLIARHFAGAVTDIARRIETARRYHEGLADLPELILPPMREDGSHIYWYYPIQFERRGELVAYAARQGRDITASYHRNCAALPCFAEFAADCPNAAATAASLVYLPTYPRYDTREVDHTIRTIRRFFGR